MNRWLEEGDRDRAEYENQMLDKFRDRIVDELDEICIGVGNDDEHYRNMYEKV